MYLTRTEPEANLHRFYSMEIVRGLFGDWGLVREWGRIGQGKGQFVLTRIGGKLPQQLAGRDDACCPG